MCGYMERMPGSTLAERGFWARGGLYWFCLTGGVGKLGALLMWRLTQMLDGYERSWHLHVLSSLGRIRCRTGLCATGLPNGGIRGVVTACGQGGRMRRCWACWRGTRGCPGRPRCCSPARSRCPSCCVRCLRRKKRAQAGYQAPRRPAPPPQPPPHQLLALLMPALHPPKLLVRSGRACTKSNLNQTCSLCAWLTAHGRPVL